MKYQMIRQNSSEFLVSEMCRSLGVSRSGYYARIKRPESHRAQRHKELAVRIKKIHDDSFQIYGSPNITMALAEEGVRASRGTVARLMRKNGIKSKVTKKFKATTNSKHDLPVAENILDRNFKASRRSEKLVSDITYIWTYEGWLYLAALLDLYNGAIVGWSMSDRMSKSLVINALDEAVKRYDPAAGLLVHSDRGAQYCSKEYQQFLTERGYICSMSRKGNCWDNAPMESFWGKLKMEWLSDKVFKTRAEARRAVFDYIELFYNTKRLRSKNGYIPPLKVPEAA